jgi:hypothetical protein
VLSLVWTGFDAGQRLLLLHREPARLAEPGTVGTAVDDLGLLAERSRRCQQDKGSAGRRLGVTGLLGERVVAVEGRETVRGRAEQVVASPPPCERKGNRGRALAQGWGFSLCPAEVSSVRENHLIELQRNYE